ncbi:MAG: hypothetical protein EA392_03080 [Cryomorphaceae bacterium]|nr:MAG: hypothetical protein EA392_03080 [Cryomorphaceae bacterium]
MKSIREKQLFRENRRLKAQLRVCNQTTQALWEELEVTEGNFLIQYYDFLEAAQKRGVAMLNPAPIKLRGEYGPEKDYGEHSIQIQNVIAIRSDRKAKFITLRRPLYEAVNEDRLTDFVCRKGFKDITKNIESLEMWLFEASRTWKVNVRYFKLKNRHLTPTTENLPSEFSELSKIKLTKQQADVFKEKKDYIVFLNSFQKIRVRSEFGMISQNESHF